MQYSLRHWFYKCMASCQMTVAVDIHFCANCSCAASMHYFNLLSHHTACLLYFYCVTFMQGFKKLLMKVVYITDTVSLVTGNVSHQLTLYCSVVSYT